MSLPSDYPGLNDQRTDERKQRSEREDFPLQPFEQITDPWDWRQLMDRCSDTCFCNICWWHGESFHGGVHCEAATCPGCGSVARDRFLFHCFITRMPPAHYRVLETSPRLSQDYRDAMTAWFDYRASDFDERHHRADVKLDLQDIHLEDGSVDVLLTAHVLEHVPDTDRALNEMYRLLSVRGRMYLQVPILQGTTARPVEPEFHGDRTPVEWRFGPDLTALLREHGFRTKLLCNQELYRSVETGVHSWPTPTSPEFDVESILASLRHSDLLAVANDQISQRLGFQPGYMFLTWEGEKS